MEDKPIIKTNLRKSWCDYSIDDCYYFYKWVAIILLLEGILIIVKYQPIYKNSLTKQKMNRNKKIKIIYLLITKTVVIFIRIRINKHY